MSAGVMLETRGGTGPAAYDDVRSAGDVGVGGGTGPAASVDTR